MDIRKDFFSAFEGLFPAGEWNSAKLDRFFSFLRYKELDAGTSILREGQICSSVPFVLEGSIRVFKVSQSGREITLYRVGPGQSCILSSGCEGGIGGFPANVVVEQAARVAFLPLDAVRRLLGEEPAFRDFMLRQYSGRMFEVIELVEEVAFRHMDERLRQWLLETGKRSPEGRVMATHREIADHLGTSREVVSRILKDLEQKGELETARGEIILKSVLRKDAL